MNYIVTIRTDWLGACGRDHLAGRQLQAYQSMGNVHSSPMGRCFEVAMLDGRFWTVFEERMESVEEITSAEQMHEWVNGGDNA